jgi:putative transposase
MSNCYCHPGKAGGLPFLFIEDDDSALYRDWLAQAFRSNGVEVWSYCLMPNPIHLILVPSDDTGLSRAVGETHRR